MSRLKILLYLPLILLNCNEASIVEENLFEDQYNSEYLIGETPLPLVEGVKDYGIDKISDQVGISKAKTIGINEEEFIRLLDSYEEDANTDYFGIFSFRKKVNDDYVYHYYIRDINFSKEIIDEANGEKVLFVVVPGKDMAGIHRTYVAWIPNSQKARDQMALWALPTETQPNPLDVGTIPDNMKSMGCDWIQTVPGGYVIIGGSVIYYPPIVEWLCENPDVPMEYEDPDMGGGGGGVCPTPGGCGTNDDCPPGEDCSVDKPCPGDPIMNPELAPTDAAGQQVDGARYGWTRNNGAKFHAGTDIQAPVNTKLHSMHDGTIYSTGSSLDLITGIGHYIIVKTVINGTAYNVPHPHVHIEVKTSVPGQSFNNWDTHNPEDLMGTNFDTNGNPSNISCNS